MDVNVALRAERLASRKLLTVAANPARRAVRVARDCHIERQLEGVDVQARVRIGHVQRRGHVLKDEERRGALQVYFVRRRRALVEDAVAAAQHELRQRARLPREADARREVVEVVGKRRIMLRLIDLTQINRDARFDVKADIERLEALFEDLGVRRRLIADRQPRLFRKGFGDERAESPVRVREVPEEVVAHAEVERQPAPRLPIVMRVPTDVLRSHVAASVALVEVRAAARRAMAGEKQRPGVVIEIAVGARLKFARQLYTAILADELEGVIYAQ